MVWFDLDNSPHVPLFKPIFNELDKRGIKYVVTARDFAQTKELLDLFKIEHFLIGTHAGKNKFKKIANLFFRARQLRAKVKKLKPTLAVSHGSRTQLIACATMGIPSLLMFDYEYTESKIFNTFSKYLLAPKFIPDTRLKEAGFKLNKLIRYNGFKEEIYLNSFVPEENFRSTIGIDDGDILVVLRPPSLVGNYHDNRSEKLILSAISHFINVKNCVILIVNRTEVEKKFILDNTQDHMNLRFLNKSVDGLQLLYAADYTISGGGTMNRESALLGTKTFSIFTGERPYLDEYLQSIGRLTFIENSEDFSKIEVKKEKKTDIQLHSKNIVQEITDLIVELSNKNKG